MVILVNSHSKSFAVGTKLNQVRETCKPDTDVVIYNGCPVEDENIIIQDGDMVSLIKRGEVPSLAEMAFLIQSRNSPEIYQKLSDKTVAIAGVGGLGSVVAISLSRLFIKKLIIVDFDVVEPSNLNRQQFFFDQIGMPKVEALKQQLQRVNPYVEIEAKRVLVDADNVEELFKDADVIAECFDNPASKKILTETVLTKMSAPIVAVSGIAGHLDVEKIICRKLSDRFILIGDGESEALPNCGLMAPKVGVAANLQACKVMELLLKL